MIQIYVVNNYRLLFYYNILTTNRTDNVHTTILPILLLGSVIKLL